MTTTEVLHRAADYIEEHGLASNMGEDGGPRCVHGTIASASIMVAKHRDYIRFGDTFRTFVRELGIGWPIDISNRHAGSLEGAAWVADLMRACGDQS